MTTPNRIGRFSIIERLGHGGMGVVYSAFDPELDRRVALKMVRRPEDGAATPTARKRLLREAQALARLSHPHVVPVHDVQVIDDAVVVIMEFVEGRTLRQWVRESKPTWREILAAYLQAARGLEAAHRVGVVHRDFKPDNALIGRDKRVWVIDFGIARDVGHAVRVPDIPPPDEDAPDTAPNPTDDDGPNAATDSKTANDSAADDDPDATTEPAVPVFAGFADSAPSHLTAPQITLGTPPYMSPEQHQSAKVGPLSDQFSFCVSLYEALYGQRPYPGRGLVALNQSIREGALRRPDKSTQVPSWVFAALRRGLSAAPEDRFPSMRALISALSRHTRRTLFTAVALASVAVGAAALAFALYWAGDSGPPPCRAGASEIARVWNDDRRDALRAAFLASDDPYAPEVWERVVAGADDYASRWAHMYNEACMTHRKGQQSSALLDHRMRCLSQRRAAVDAAIDVIGESVDKNLASAIDVVVDLPPLSRCANIELLLPDVDRSPPPDTPRFAALRARLARARALERIGRYSDAESMLRPLVDEIEADAPSLVPEALLLDGWVQMQLSQREKATQLLERAIRAALAGRADETAIEAIARYAFVQGTSPGGAEAALAMAGVGESLLNRIPDSTFAHALLLNNTGIVHNARGERERAREYFERALAVTQRDRNAKQVELTSILHNLILVVDDEREREPLISRSLEDVEHTLGASHPITLRYHLSYSHFVAAPSRALALLSPTCDNLMRFHPHLRHQRSRCRAYLGFLYSEANDPERAVREYTSAAEQASQAARETTTTTTEYPIYAHLFRGYARLLDGDATAAVTEFQACLTAIQTLSKSWWHRAFTADAYLGLGLAALADTGPDAGARAASALESALREFDALLPLQRSLDVVSKNALARLSLARALIQSLTPSQPECPPRIVALLDQAEAWYGGVAVDYPGRLDAIAQLRRLAGCPDHARAP